MPAPVADLAAELQRAIVDLERGGVVAVELGEDREVPVGRRDAGNDRRSSRGRRGCPGTASSPSGSRPGAGRRPRPGGACRRRRRLAPASWNVRERGVESLRRLLVAALALRRLGERRVGPGDLERVAGPAAAVDRASPATASARASPPTTWSTFASFSCASTLRAALEQRDEPLEVLDRRRVRVGRPRGVGRAAEVQPLPLVVVAQPEVVGEEVEAAIDPVRIGSLEPAADQAVEPRPQPERQALVRDLLGRDVLEQVGVLEVAVEADEVRRPQLDRAARGPRRAIPSSG